MKNLLRNTLVKQIGPLELNKRYKVNELVVYDEITRIAHFAGYAIKYPKHSRLEKEL